MVKRLGAVAALGVIALLASGCSADEAMRFGWPEGITPEGHDMRVFWQWACIAALVMGTFVWGLIFWTITFHRRKKNATAEEEFPRQTAYNVPLELVYTAVPFILIAILFYFTVMVQTTVEKKEPNPPVAIDVTAFQWNWKFGYNSVRTQDGQQLIDSKDSKKGGPFDLQIPEYYEHDGEQKVKPLPAGGRSDDVRDYLTFDKIETLGTSSEVPVLVLPTNTRIQFNLASADVIHSFWVPEFVFKRDVMPFPEANHQDPVFQISSIDREGAFVGRCAEMCGTYHAMMNFEVRAVSPQVFEQYIKYRVANPNATNAQALQAVCQEPLSVVTKPFDTRRVSTTEGADGPRTENGLSNTTLANCQPQAAAAAAPAPAQGE
ncbi:MAG: cytochrome c oxidase subunit II [Gordonia sp. (in: high G+C Gram-positive bacteria)]|uniref:aa3-type cytochrome oxidase subunit II n=1 Tax=Gordonia sp. (in: high G+C Gram-positive bacteria) TaxID=84139 RepID=UPI0039E3794F